MKINKNLENLSKRLMDLLVSLAGLGLLWPFLILVGIAIKITSLGPVIFKQVRIGKGGSLFTLYKFRTMRLNTPEVPTHKISNAALTPLGSLLRKTKLDELPQLYNVLRGEMSLVGPRPSLPSQKDLIEARTVSGGLTVPPGMTGLAQVYGIDMSDVKRLAKIDGYYVKTRTFTGDLLLLMRTFVKTKSPPKKTMSL